MIERRHRFGFLNEAAQAAFICRELRGKEFESDSAVESRVLCKEDFAHAASAQESKHLVRADDLTSERCALVSFEHLGHSFSGGRINHVRRFLANGN